MDLGRRRTRRRQTQRHNSRKKGGGEGGGGGMIASVLCFLSRHFFSSLCPAFSTRNRGSTCESAGRTKFHVIFRRSRTTNDFRYTSTDPPMHGLPANCAIDSWPWLSPVSVLGVPMPCTLVRSCLCQTCRVLDGRAAAAHQNVPSYDVSLL